MVCIRRRIWKGAATKSVVRVHELLPKEKRLGVLVEVVRYYVTLAGLRTLRLLKYRPRASLKLGRVFNSSFGNHAYFRISRIIQRLFDLLAGCSLAPYRPFRHGRWPHLIADE